ncbi:MAG: LicD family protein [Lachnospiraceae bacterium]|nr:LicD family protein [Lachnospiraceae bacterium]
MVKLDLVIPEDFYKEEVRCGYTVTETMKKVWAVEMDLMVKLLDICKKYDLRIFMDGGSLIGTVRDKGFIPWDDDIDLIMFRKDYDRLCEVAPGELKPPYFFQNFYTDKGYTHGHSQLRNSETTAILGSELEKGKRKKYNQGIFVDIFVLDGVEDDPEIIEKQKDKMFRYKRFMHYIYGDSRPGGIKGKLMLAKFKLFHTSAIKYAKKIEDELRSHSIEKCEFCAPLGYIFDTEYRVRNKHSYDETIWLPFEFLTVPAPAGYDENLKRTYGDYMKPAKAPTDHGGVFFDPERPYREYIEKE